MKVKRKKSKYKSKFERTQAYMRHKKSESLKELAFKFRNELIDLETPPETMFKYYLLKLRLKYEFQKIVYAGKSFYIVDFYIPRWNIIFEIDGKQHSEVENIEKDEDRTCNLKHVGVRQVYRFTNDDVYHEQTCINRIKDIVKQERLYKK